MFLKFSVKITTFRWGLAEITGVLQTTSGLSYLSLRKADPHQYKVDHQSIWGLLQTFLVSCSEEDFGELAFHYQDLICDQNKPLNLLLFTWQKHIHQGEEKPDSSFILLWPGTRWCLTSETHPLWSCSLLRVPCWGKNYPSKLKRNISVSSC